MKSKLFKLLKSVLFIVFLIAISCFIFFMTIMQNWDSPKSDATYITFFYYSLGFIIIWLLFAFWSGYKNSKEILIAAVLYAFIPIINTLSYSFNLHKSVVTIKPTENPSIFTMSRILWSSISSGIVFIFTNIFGRPAGIVFFNFIDTYFPLIMLILFVITYFLARKISLYKKLKDKPALD